MGIWQKHMTFRPGVGQPTQYWVDTIAELPSSGLLTGADLAFCYEDRCWYAATSSTQWTKASAAGGGGAHDHPISEVTGLQTALDGKAASDHTHQGGSDPWTTVVLANAFSSTLTANTAVTGLAFTPAANKTYVIEGYFLLRTATATVGPRPGFAFPTGLTDGGAWMNAPNSATAYAFRAWGPLNTQNAASTGVPDTTTSHLAIGGALIISGATPSGNFQVTLASETAGTSVTMRAGSFIRYREI